MSRLDEAQRAVRVDFATVDKRALLVVALDRGEWHRQSVQDGVVNSIQIFAVSSTRLQRTRPLPEHLRIGHLISRPYLVGI
jgi:hypothetical protein